MFFFFFLLGRETLFSLTFLLAPPHFYWLLLKEKKAFNLVGQRPGHSLDCILLVRGITVHYRIVAGIGLRSTFCSQTTSCGWMDKSDKRMFFSTGRGESCKLWGGRRKQKHHRLKLYFSLMLFLESPIWRRGCQVLDELFMNWYFFLIPFGTVLCTWFLDRQPRREEG